MGAFYTNITLQTSDLKSLITQMKKKKRNGYILTVSNRFTVLYDQGIEDQNAAMIENLSSEISERLACAAFTVLVHDSDVFAYWLYQNGKLIDEYNSDPTYFDNSVNKTSYGGNAQQLCHIFDVPERAEQVSKIFQRVKKGIIEDSWDGGYLNGGDIHRELATALRLPINVAVAGYYAIEGGFLSDDFPKDKLIQIHKSSRWRNR